MLLINNQTNELWEITLYYFENWDIKLIKHCIEFKYKVRKTYI